MLKDYHCGTSHSHLPPVVPAEQHRTGCNMFKKINASLWVKYNSVRIEYYGILTGNMQK